MRQAIVLLSGGLDSTTTLAIAKNEGYYCHALTFDYGQTHRAEIKVAEHIAKVINADSFRILSLPLDEIGGSALTDSRIKIPDYQPHQDIPVTYVPARNTIFLSMALAYAETKGAEAIFIGVTHIDYSGYPDCRPEYIDVYNKLAALATKQGVEGVPVRIATPLLYLNKAEIIRKGHDLGIDYSLTVSCYRLNAKAQSCGFCESCVLRKQAFIQADIKDTTRYVV